MRLLSILALLILPAVAGAKTALEPHVYKKLTDRELTLYVIRPEGAKADERRPAIVYFHGGGWVGGKPTQFETQARYFASRGLVTVLVEYRLLGKGDKAPPTVCVQDAKSAMRWVRGHAAELGVDPDRIASAGGSAGGHLAAAVSTLPGLDDPQDDLAVSPKSNAMLLFNPVFNNGPGQWGYERVGERYKEFSPAHNITAETPPAIVFLGDKDKHIPVQVLNDFKAAMEKAGVRCEAHVYAGQEHGFFNHSSSDPAADYASQTTRAADLFLNSLGWVKGDPTIAPVSQPTR